MMLPAHVGGLDDAPFYLRRWTEWLGAVDRNVDDARSECCWWPATMAEQTLVTDFVACWLERSLDDTRLLRRPGPQAQPTEAGAVAEAP